MFIKTLLVASVLTIAPLVATAHADCGGDIKVVAGRIDAVDTTPAAPRAGDRSPELTGWAVTWNRMATAAQNAYAAVLPPEDTPASGAQGGMTAQDVTKAKQPVAFPTGKARQLAEARDSLQVARAAHARGDETLCQSQIAAARTMLETLS